jgi:hypothetical protein
MNQIHQYLNQFHNDLCMVFATHLHNKLVFLKFSMVILSSTSLFTFIIIGLFNLCLYPYFNFINYNQK